jgi:polysaccharide export outer membrane protein
VNSGWPLVEVNDAILYVRSADKESTGGTAPPATEKPSSPENAKPETPLADGNAHGSTAGETAKPPEGAKATSAAAGASPGTVNRGVPDDYQIGAGDVLEINVWKEPDASVRGVVVRPDGKISMPLLKEVSVVGLTPVELEKLITGRLTDLINSPDVTIVVTGINSKKIYVQGKVKKEGPIPYTYRMTVMQALSEAGGLTDYAKKKGIYVLRNENGKEFRLPFDYAAVLKGQHMELNVQLVPGDMIVVP